MSLSSRDRVLRAVAGEAVDHVPLCFLMWDGLRRRTAGQRDYVERQLAVGLDALVSLPHVGWEHDPAVTTEVRVEDATPHPLIHKVYHTPGGDLTTVAEQTADWPHGDDVPLMSDFGIPRSRVFAVSGEDDLAPLECLLRPPSSDAVDAFRRQADERRALAREHGLALMTPMLRMVDAACWLCGPVNFATWCLTEPEFMSRLVGILARWQRAQADAFLAAGPDIFVRAEWYASPFLSPALFGGLFGEVLRQEIEAVHAARARYCYVGTAGMMPFLGDLADLGVDVVYGIDPIEGGWDMAAAREQCRGRMALWGGINGYLQVVFGSPEQTDEAVASALSTLGPDGFLLSPVDDVGLGGTQQDTDANWQHAWANVERMAEAWRRLR